MQQRNQDQQQQTGRDTGISRGRVEHAAAGGRRRDVLRLVDVGLVAAECVKPHTFEREIFFEGCLPIEEMARRGPQTLAFGPLKPVGLRRSDMSTLYAVVQLRLEDALRRAYNMVGFQTRLMYAEQRRVFRMIPGLEQAEFLMAFGLPRREAATVIGSTDESLRVLTRNKAKKTAKGAS